MTMNLSYLPQQSRSAGFNLSELMIAMAIGMIVLAGMATLFATNSRAQAEIEKNNRQVENGRYAVQMLSSDIVNAGYFSEFDSSRMPDPAALPAPCQNVLAQLHAGLAFPVQGVDNAQNADLPCLAGHGLKEGTDVLVIRRTQTCLPGAGNCAPTASGGVFFQASLCLEGSELGNALITEHYRLDTVLANLNRRGYTCDATKLAARRRYLTHIYFISNNGVGADGIPTLKRAELGGQPNALSFEIVPLVEGVENLQIEYGIDKDALGVPALYHANPSIAMQCGEPVCDVKDWRAVVALKLNILARNVEPSVGFTDTKSYTLGNMANGAAYTVPAQNDQFKRHVYQTVVTMPNPAGRRTP